MQANEYSAKYSAAVSNLAVYRELAKVVSNVKTAECPVCGSPIKDTDRLTKCIHKLTVEAQSADPSKMLAYLEQLHQENRAVDSGNASQQRSYSVLQVERTKRFAQADAMFKQAQASTPPLPRTIDELRAEILELTGTRTHLMNTQLAHTRLATTLGGMRDKLAKLEQDRAGLLNVLRVYYKDPVDNDLPAYIAAFGTQVDTMNKQITEIRTLNEQFAGLKGMVQELANSLASLDNTMAVLEKKRADQSVRREVSSTLGSVRDWFHYLNGPHTITAGVLNEMTADVNRFLDYFTAPFCVQPSQEVMGYKVMFTDGRPMPSGELPDASVLSGGEKILLATSFRFASYCTFAGKQGILSLDEPTVYLDTNNVSRFCTLLEKIRDLAKQMNLQVFISTHERSIMPFVDKLIDLSA
jgi:DNA repair exonuclease SbcCD ATPase subunit